MAGRALPRTIGISSSSIPRRVVADTAFVAVTAGGSHSCALTAAGAAFCWGSNAAGQLGDGSRQNGFSFKTSPVPVAGGVAFIQISAGGSHTCALAAAGAAYCWGANAAGQLGTGAADSLAITPQPVSGAPRGPAATRSRADLASPTESATPCHQTSRKRP